MNLLIRYLTTLFILFTAIGSYADLPIPEESGFTGYLILGATYNNTGSNMFVGTKGGDLTEETAKSLTASPESKEAVGTTFLGEIKYTFANSRTQLMLGNVFTDFVRYDSTVLAGVRQDVEHVGTLGASYVFSGFTTSVWADPYVINQAREKTNRDQTGYRIAWERMFDTELQLQYTSRKIDIDEQSGKTQLGLTDAETLLLNRNGYYNELQFLYYGEISEHHILVPEFLYNQSDRDGKAMSGDSIGGRLTYTFLWLKTGSIVIANATYTEGDNDAINPIYNKTQSNTLTGVGITYLQFGWFGLKELASVVDLYSFRDDSNIDFYDTKIEGMGLGFMYRL